MSLPEPTARLAEARRLTTAYQAGGPDAVQAFRDLVDMPADVTITAQQVEVSFHRRSHLPTVLTSGLLDQPVPIPWWNGVPLRLTTYHGPA
ncbi:MAG: hypothetical protein HY712_04230 [candidate division NC10 bacterium]|nr:hypothetical protein [candidate division NC10 bacterium]